MTNTSATPHPSQSNGIVVCMQQMPMSMALDNPGHRNTRIFLAAVEAGFVKEDMLFVLGPKEPRPEHRDDEAVSTR